jgi:hypothetical protein
MSAVWPDVYVADGTLNRTITELRDLLGDETMIETVPRRGYRFAMEVEDANPPSATWSRFAVAHGDRTIPLLEGPNVIGRTPDCEVQILASSISRHHARITTSGSTATIEDLGSTNGTFVDGKRIESPTRIAAKQKLRLGREALRFLDSSQFQVSTEKVV